MLSPFTQEQRQLIHQQLKSLIEQNSDLVVTIFVVAQEDLFRDKEKLHLAVKKGEKCSFRLLYHFTRLKLVIGKCASMWRIPSNGFIVFYSGKMVSEQDTVSSLNMCEGSMLTVLQHPDYTAIPSSTFKSDFKHNYRAGSRSNFIIEVTIFFLENTLFFF